LISWDSPNHHCLEVIFNLVDRLDRGSD